MGDVDSERTVSHSQVNVCEVLVGIETTTGVYVLALSAQTDTCRSAVCHGITLIRIHDIVLSVAAIPVIVREPMVSRRN